MLIVVGTIAAIVNGVAMPLMTVLLGDLIDSFGQSDNKNTVSVVSKVALNFVYLGIGSGVASFFQVACWMVTGERQASQDVAFFDMETNTGEVVGRMSGDTVLIQDAMGEKVGKFIQLIATFIGGFVIAFIKGWLLTLVMLTSIPPMVASGCGYIDHCNQNGISRTSCLLSSREYRRTNNRLDQNGCIIYWGETGSLQL
ncbi:hypothetical protein MKW92_036361 [Papaver armeniacum]|nr:hypothetical protein MKW92_036361 [Papaver armeniacum]